MRESANPRPRPGQVLLWFMALLVTILFTVGGSGSLLAAGLTQEQPPPALPAPPELVSPEEGSRTCNASPVFMWKRVRGASFYRLQVDDDPNFGSPDVDVVTENTFYFLDRELPLGTWHWRVRGANEEQMGDWSASWSVTIVVLPLSPSLLSPPDGSSNCDGMPVLKWSPVDETTSYRVLVDDDPGFGSPELDENTSEPSYALPQALAPGTYYWQVQAQNECGDSLWSAARSFVVLVPPTVPVLLEPPNKSTIKERTPNFTWVEVGGATFYRIQIAEGPEFNSPLIDEVTLDAFFVPASSLSTKTYYWRVQAAAACGRSEWSDPWSVTISNEMPIAGDDGYKVDEDSPWRALNVLSNDRDPDGDTLEIVGVTQPAFGTVSIAESRDHLLYRPDPDFFGRDDLTYTIGDGYGGTDTAGVALTVIGLNDLPVADAGSDQSVPTSAAVTLDGSGSHDPDRNLPLRYFWTQTGGAPVALSSGIAVRPTFVAPGEPSTLTFSLLVMDATGEPSVADQTTVTVYAPPVYYAYLPSIGRDQVVAPDLIVQQILATQATLRVVIANRGKSPVTEGFFVDLYINPRYKPQAVNQTWDQLGDYGVVWGVTGHALASLVPGGSVALEIGDRYYIESLSSVPGSMPAGTRVYAQVDSFNPGSAYGTVLEEHEIQGGAYNNVHGPVSLTAAVSAVGLPHPRSGPYFR